jgi:hypothetical protein
MRALVASLCFLAAFAPAAPASAQFVQPHTYGSVVVSNPFIGDSRQHVGDSRQHGPGVGRELHAIRERIHEEREAGILSRHEARRLRREANAIAELADRYDGQGMPQSAQDELEARTHYLSDAVNRPR